MLFDGYGNVVSSGGTDNNFFDVTYPKYKNLFNPTDYIPDIAPNNYGNINTTVAWAGAYTTKPVDVTEHVGEYVYCEFGQRNPANPHVTYTAKLHAQFVAFYNANNNFISRTSNVPVQVPENAVYMVITFCQRYGTQPLYPPEQYFYCFAPDNTADVIPFELYYPMGAYSSAYIRHENLTYKDKPLTENKTWVLFGDSITDNYGGKSWDDDGFASKIAREFGLVLDNRGKSGSNLCVSTDSYASVSGVTMLDAFLAEIEAGTIEQPEYITIAFGANCYDTYVGKSTDTSATTKTSYYGAMKYFIEKLREKCPNSVFGFVLAHDVDWSATSAPKQAGVPLGREAMKAVCDEYRVPYINMYTESGITANMLNDGVHINTEQSANLYYHAMRRFMIGL